jgi:hypothetical protein
MNFVLGTLLVAQGEIGTELDRLKSLEGYPNEKLRQISIKSNENRMKQLEQAIEIIANSVRENRIK